MSRTLRLPQAGSKLAPSAGAPAGKPVRSPLVWPCLSVHAEGTLLLVNAVPNARRTELAGLHDGCLRVRLAAPAIEGRANAALLAWLCESLHLPRRAVSLLAGDSARRKRLLLLCPISQVEGWLAVQVSPQNSMTGSDSAAEPGPGGS
jgi:uncharacterized protein YggU (UPF0235/DUF167 family)